eukprot:CAMPEP_0174244780 /NCGR_PEP_ID=MMETSP0417-20130205/36623_1 /TAXON_ID=242541 /ORGANISM="Mayorella sp, Strain BSH-02190019" /LENGTH=756 /DNA_ID=CAMNT_0015324503 /DNA_START=51 /DNA_END=2321 /DNA_ORIENTATION=-
MPPQKRTLNEIWPKLEHGLSVILATLDTEESLSVKEWFELYDCVHNHCTTSQRAPMTMNRSRAASPGASFVGEDLYNLLQHFLETYMTKLFSDAEGKEEDALLVYYSKRWENYTVSMSKVNHVFQYLNRHWIKREAEDGKKVYEVYVMSLVKWHDHMFLPLKERLTSGLLTLIERDRTGEQVDHSLIKGVINSFACLGLDDSGKGSNLDVYLDCFQRPFLDRTSLFYTQESAQFIASNTVSDYMRKVEGRFQEEDLRVGQYLHETSRTALMKTLELVLIDAHKEAMWGIFQELLHESREEDLKRIYSLLCRLSDGLQPLQASLEEYAKQFGQKEMSAVAKSANEDPRQFVESLLSVYHRFNNLVENAFSTDPEFVAALDKACRLFINHNAFTENSKGRSVAAELLARFADTVLRHTKQRLEESEREKMMDEVMVLFKYLEEKDAFMSYYGKCLANRLINRSSASDHLEGQMITKLKEACGFEHTNSLSRMYQDMSVCKDLETSFRSHLEANETRLPIDFDVLVLTKGIWPLKDAPSPIDLPPQVEECKELFETFYSSKHQSRKLTWLVDRCKGEIKCLHLPKPYILQCSLYEVGILMQFSTTKILSASALVERTSMQESLLLQVLVVLMRTRVLVSRPSQGPLTLKHQFTLNPKFQNPRIKVNINLSLPGEQKADRGETQRQIEEGRNLEIQACIVRIMKMRKQQEHRLLVAEVIEQLHRRFEANVGRIKRCIDILIEKEYLERASGKKDTYSYMA